MMAIRMCLIAAAFPDGGKKQKAFPEAPPRNAPPAGLNGKLFKPRMFSSKRRLVASLAQDIARKKPTEIDYLNGYIVSKGRELGIATPANKALYVMVKLLEAKAAGAHRRQNLPS